MASEFARLESAIPDEPAVSVPPSADVVAPFDPHAVPNAASRQPITERRRASARP